MTAVSTGHSLERLREAVPLPLRDVAGVDGGRAVALAVDLGTGGPKVAVVSSTGRVLAHAYRPVAIRLGDDGSAEQDPEEWWRAVAAAARAALAEAATDPADVVVVGCTAQWGGTVPVTADGEADGPAVIWLDSRGAAAVRRAYGGPVAGYSPAKALRWIRVTGGAPSLSGKDPVGHILHLREAEPDRYRRAAVFLEPVDYLNLRLTGVARASFDSITMHWVTDNRHIDRVAYHPGLLSMSGLDRGKLPELVPTGTMVGGLAPPAAEALGLMAGTPVATGCADLHSAAVGSGAVADYQAHLYIGTSSWISCHVPFKKTAVVSNIASIPSALPGRYLVADEHETGGACLTWLRDKVVWPDDGLGPAAPPDALTAMNDLAASSPPGARGVLFTPWLNGERSPVDDHTIRAGFHNMSLSTTRADLVRAVFEGVALNSAWLLGAVEKFVGRRLDTLSFVGGGATSDLWAQLHADATGRTVRQLADPVLANVRGAGLLALHAAGRMTVGQMAAAPEVRAEYRPDPDGAALYAGLLAEFTELYDKTKAIHRRLNGARLAGH